MAAFARCSLPAARRSQYREADLAVKSEQQQASGLHSILLWIDGSCTTPWGTTGYDPCDV